jgi:6-pyruvoyl-tetrahydropterin synthase
MDFGGLKEIKDFLKNWFDHTFLVAKDDPYLNEFMKLEDCGVIKLRILENPSIEGTAEFVAQTSQKILDKITGDRSVRIESVEVIENHKNSAKFIF